ncbi:DUF202 domain-containing protein [Kibdelosporangium phytohabitans]|uniref:DUF202 domain-containing protein n=1 Tax=Kibdelosporangium phytohabitans TaxID=860235 RepID=A0A0N9IDM2_9PSEU|nr:DUF202 domain-containing protein [Kibdelosporangium phytohabitans]ALG12866.1 hypothetical protein AOZ06_43810 [Kibdelosporangium phytohabitans]MBE1464565.1 uncharacterized membrane protein YidH (DUF202 family) [Kibdelosporangium phytohabitans]
MRRHPWDPGLQVERTALAWMRTCLSMIVVALIAFRFAAHTSLAAALALAAVVVPMALVSLRLAWRRYRTSDANLTSGKRLPDGTLPLAVTIVTALTGALGLVYVLVDR